jgi:hypothetical protein
VSVVDFVGRESEDLDVGELVEHPSPELNVLNGEEVTENMEPNCVTLLGVESFKIHFDLFGQAESGNPLGQMHVVSVAIVPVLASDGAGFPLRESEGQNSVIFPDTFDDPGSDLLVAGLFEDRLFDHGVDVGQLGLGEDSGRIDDCVVAIGQRPCVTKELDRFGDGPTETTRTAVFHLVKLGGANNCIDFGIFGASTPRFSVISRLPDPNPIWELFGEDRKGVSDVFAGFLVDHRSLSLKGSTLSHNRSILLRSAKVKENLEKNGFYFPFFRFPNGRFRLGLTPLVCLSATIDATHASGLKTTSFARCGFVHPSSNSF